MHLSLSICVTYPNGSSICYPKSYSGKILAITDWVYHRRMKDWKCCWWRGSWRILLLERKWWWQRWGISLVNKNNHERRKIKGEEDGESVQICWSKSILGYRSKHMCVAFFFHVYMRFERETDKKDGNWISSLCSRFLQNLIWSSFIYFFFFFNGEILRGYAGVRVTKRSILIFHFTIYPISNILFFYHFI